MSGDVASRDSDAGDPDGRGPDGRDLEGQVAIVTGAASGIGLAAAHQLARRGAALALADIDADGLAGAEAAVAAHGTPVVARVTDVSDRQACADLVETTVSELGRLDVAFNNAGVSEPLQTLGDLDPDVWARVLAVNLSGVAWCLQAEVRVLLDQGDGGAIVNTSSGSGIVPGPLNPAYTASKHGVLGLTKLAAQELAASGIRVNAILPGATDTAMLRRFLADNPGMDRIIRRSTPTGELVTAEEVAQTAVWLLSPAAAGVSGQSVIVDRGAILR